MVDITITLQADLVLTDDGGDYEDEQGINANQIQGKLRARKAHYQAKYKRRGRGDRQEQDTITIVNLLPGGEVFPSPVRKEDA